ncbi:MAG: hypothetical protein LBI56_02705 [Puniceicoccales bacterium]|nr:hypothetical protein [Puniceicoccales bacterium]
MALAKNSLWRPILWVGKFLLKAIAVTVAVLCLFLLAGNLWIPKVVKATLGKVSGFNVAIEKSNGAIFRGRVDISKFRIENPKPLFVEPNFLTVNRFVADVSMRSLLSSNIVVDDLVIDVGDITLVKNADGTNNYMLFGNNLLEKFSGEKSSKKKTSAAEKKSKEKGKSDSEKNEKSFLIRKFVLSVGTINIVDESSNSTRTFAANYSREFTSISDISAIRGALIADFGKYGLTILIDPIISAITDLPKTSIDGMIKVKDISVETVSKIGDAASNVGSSIGQGVQKLLKKRN